MVTSDWAPPSPTQRTNRLARAALVCGILEPACLFPLAIIAIFLGHKARSQIRQNGERGHGLATTGLILGYIGISLIVVVLAVALAVAY
jgi:uncharacterized membrane protein YidH (DUF202 family)